MDERAVRVLIVDDQDLIRTGLRMVLTTMPELEIVGEAGSGEQALAALAGQAADVVLMDVRMPEMDGIEATRLIRASFPQTRVLLLTTFDEDRLVQAGLHAGADGYLLKDAPPEELARALCYVARGWAAIDPGITKRYLDRFRTVLPALTDTAGGGPQELTAREQEIFMLVASGLTNTEISENLGISPVTVRTHVDGILAKLSLRNRAQIIIYAYESGIIRPSRRFDEDSSRS